MGSIRYIINIMNFLHKNPKLALYVKNFNDEKTGFILCPHEEIKEIWEGIINYGCHSSKTRFAIALKACQLILRGTHTLEDFMTDYDQNVVAYEEKDEEAEAEAEADADADADADVFFDYRHEQALERNKQRYLEREGDKSDNGNGNAYHLHNYSYYS
jgi:hypothetical protein